MSESKSILITGFSPFGGEIINPSIEAVKLLPDSIGNIRLIKAEIPTAFNKSIDAIRSLLIKHHPSVVICTGQAGFSDCIRLEKVAINYMDASIPDNDGYMPHALKIIPEGPDAFFSRLDILQLKELLSLRDIPVSISYSAGTYVCNCVMYSLLYYCQKILPDIPSGFVHIPFLPEQIINKPSGTPSMNMNLIVDAFRIICDFYAENI